MIPALALMLAVMAATWDAWRWYFARVGSAPEEAAALVLTVAFIVTLSWRTRVVPNKSRSIAQLKGPLPCGRGIGRVACAQPSTGGTVPSRPSVPADPSFARTTGEGAVKYPLLTWVTTDWSPPNPSRLPYWTASLLLILYAASFGTLPPIGRAAFAVAAALLCLYHGLYGRYPPVAFWGLVALSLPVLPSLQFTLGYGMRVVSAALTVGVLQGQGFEVARQGTFLVWNGEMVQFDAPCSGVNMLWAGLLMAFMGSLALRLSLFQTTLVVMLSVVLTVVGNVLRAASLFVIETGMVPGLPTWGHEAVGVAAFLLTAAGLMWTFTRYSDAPGRHDTAEGVAL